MNRIYFDRPTSTEYFTNIVDECTSSVVMWVVLFITSLHLASMVPLHHNQIPMLIAMELFLYIKNKKPELVNDW